MIIRTGCALDIRTHPGELFHIAEASIYAMGEIGPGTFIINTQVRWNTCLDQVWINTHDVMDKISLL